MVSAARQYAIDTWSPAALWGLGEAEAPFLDLVGDADFVGYFGEGSNAQSAALDVGGDGATVLTGILQSSPGTGMSPFPGGTGTVIMLVSGFESSSATARLHFTQEGTLAMRTAISYLASPSTGTVQAAVEVYGDGSTYAFIASDLQAAGASAGVAVVADGGDLVVYRCDLNTGEIITIPEGSPGEGLESSRSGDESFILLHAQDASLVFDEPMVIPGVAATPEQVETYFGLVVTGGDGPDPDPDPDPSVSSHQFIKPARVLREPRGRLPNFDRPIRRR